jgi:hypothetical protein
MSTRGGGEVRVLESIAENRFALGDRGVYFLNSRSSDPSQSLKFLNFTTHAIKTIATVRGPIADDEISVSPDERWMLYGKMGGEGSELMLIENFH